MTIRLGFEVTCPRCKHEDGMRLRRAEGTGRYYLECRYCDQKIYGFTSHIAEFRKRIKSQYPNLIGKPTIRKY
jgi:transcription elongation factor Elf1